MKSLLKTSLLVGGIVLSGLTYAQKKTSLSVSKSNPIIMDSIQLSKNKETILNLYNTILNQRKLEQLKDIISDEYVNFQGIKGAEGFQKQIAELLKAFPDAKWEVEEIIAEGNKVVVRQKLKGTHTATFQKIAATGKVIENNGIGIYEFKDGKIVNNNQITDRLGFLQQLEVIPVDFTSLLKKEVEQK